VADQVDEHGRGFLWIRNAQRAVRRAVGEQALERLGEHLLGEGGTALLVKDGVALGVTERVEQLEVAVHDVAQRCQRELEPLERSARSGHGRPQGLAVLALQLLSQSGEQGVPGDPAPVQGHPRKPGLVGKPLKREPLPAMALNRPPRPVEQARVDLRSCRTLGHRVTAT
jgi:hypothetical protein